MEYTPKMKKPRYKLMPVLVPVIDEDDSDDSNGSHDESEIILPDIGPVTIKTPKNFNDLSIYKSLYDPSCKFTTTSVLQESGIVNDATNALKLSNQSNTLYLKNKTGTCKSTITLPSGFSYPNLTIPSQPSTSSIDLPSKRPNIVKVSRVACRQETQLNTPKHVGSNAISIRKRPISVVSKSTSTRKHLENERPFVNVSSNKAEDTENNSSTPSLTITRVTSGEANVNAALLDLDATQESLAFEDMVKSTRHLRFKTARSYSRKDPVVTKVTSKWSGESIIISKPEDLPEVLPMLDKAVALDTSNIFPARTTKRDGNLPDEDGLSNSKSLYMKRMLRESGPLYDCPLCVSLFRKRFFLKNHMKYFHEIDSMEKFPKFLTLLESSLILYTNEEKEFFRQLLEEILYYPKKMRAIHRFRRTKPFKFLAIPPASLRDRFPINPIESRPKRQKYILKWRKKVNSKLPPPTGNLPRDSPAFAVEVDHCYTQSSRTSTQSGKIQNPSKSKTQTTVINIDKPPKLPHVLKVSSGVLKPVKESKDTIPDRVTLPVAIAPPLPLSVLVKEWQEKSHPPADETALFIEDVITTSVQEQTIELEDKDGNVVADLDLRSFLGSSVSGLSEIDSHQDPFSDQDMSIVSFSTGRDEIFNINNVEKPPRYPELPPDTYSCRLCYFLTKDQNELFEHRLTHVPQFQCPICLLLCQNQKVFGVHMESCHEAKVGFNVENNDLVLMSTVDSTARPLEVKENVYNPKDAITIEYHCQGCGFHSIDYEQFSDHVKTEHVKPCKCIRCSKEFQHELVMVEHMKECLYLGPPINEAQYIETFKAPRVQFVGPYICQFCYEEFDTKPEFRRHEYIWHHTNRYDCIFCKGKFYKRQLLRGHYRTSHQLGCRLCGIEFPTFRELWDHRNEHPKKQTLVCEDCGKTFHNSNYFHDHMNSHKGLKTHKCKFCGEKFSYYFALEVHRTREHNISRESRAGGLCSTCGKHFKIKKNLQMHQELHERFPDLPIIPKLRRKNRIFAKRNPRRVRDPATGNLVARDPKLKVKRNLKVSKKNAETAKPTQLVKPLECQHCGISYTIPTDLWKHQESHGTISDFQCQHCKLYFLSETNLSTHVELNYCTNFNYLRAGGSGLQPKEQNSGNIKSPLNNVELRNEAIRAPTLQYVRKELGDFNEEVTAAIESVIHPQTVVTNQTYYRGGLISNDNAAPTYVIVSQGSDGHFFVEQQRTEDSVEVLDDYNP